MVNVYTQCCLKAEPNVESDQHKLLMQIKALVLQKSFLAVQAMACLVEVGTALFAVPETSFNQLMYLEATVAFMERDFSP